MLIRISDTKSTTSAEHNNRSNDIEMGFVRGMDLPEREEEGGTTDQEDV